MPIPPKIVAVSVQLPRLAPAIALGTPSQATVLVTLPRLTVAGVIERPDEFATISILLPRLAPHIEMSHPDVAVVHVRLPRLGVAIRLGGRSSLTSLTGHVSSTGSAYLHFHGPALRALTWSLVSGLGTLDNIVDNTDEQGNATARYRPLGFTGTAIIQVAHGS